MREYIGYHGTNSEAAEAICETQTFKLSRKEDEWLGEGVYFFCDCEDAIWWCKKNQEQFSSTYSVLEAIIHAENIIDLSHSYNDMKVFKTFCLIVKEKSERMTNGEKRKNYISLALKLMVTKIKADIVIAAFDCNRGFWLEGMSTKQRDMFVKKFPIIVTQVQICVKNKECINKETIQYSYNLKDF